MAKKNNEILDQIRDNASAEYQARVPEALGTGGNVSKIFNQYPSMKNEFIQTLTNRVIKSYFYSKVFNNPLKMLHRGELEYGYSLEQLFTEMAESKGFFEHFDGGDEVKDLVGVKKPSIKTLYIERNFAYKYKTSISDRQLKTAFMSQNGLSELVSQITNSMVSGAYFDEFKDMKRVLTAHANGKFLAYNDATGKAVETNLTDAILKEGQLPHLITIPQGANAEETAKNLSEKVRETTGYLGFPSTTYNSAKVKQWSDKQDLIFITTPTQLAKLDVQVLADAFNVSKADLNVRTIEVDELPTKFATGTLASATRDVVKTCYGILMDKDFLQCYDTLLETRSFENGDKLTTNMFLHKQGIMSTCYFGNIVYFVG